MTNLIEKVAAIIRDGAFKAIPFEQRARAAIAMVLKDQYEAYALSSIYDAPVFLRDYARENGIELLPIA